MMTDPAIDALMRSGLAERVFPGAVLLAAKGDAPFFFEAYGHANLFSGQPMTRDTVFDLASLTKPLATTLAVARLADRGAIDLDQAIVHWLPMLGDSDMAAVTTRQLLGHQGGLPAHRRFYMHLKRRQPTMRPNALMDLLKQTPLICPPGSQRIYSDLGFMLLCRLVEAVSGTGMDRFLDSHIYAPLGVRGDLFFVNLTRKHCSRRDFAATELCPLRNRLLIGEVHDDNAWFAGGIDGHAGLFGTAKAVFRLLRGLVNARRPDGQRRILSNRMLNDILTGCDANPLPLGFDRPAASDSSAGQHFSDDSVGHLGFTGVSFWMDLQQDVCIVLLTNRVHPTRWNNRLHRFRPQIHDRIMELFGN